MANKKINQLVSKTAILSTDIFGIGDATTGQLFKKTIAELQAAIGGAVISVNGLVGTVVLDTDDIQELATPTNKYFTDARARGAISLTVTGNSGASTYSSGTGVLNVPTYTLAGLGGITATFLSGTSGISYNSTTGVISYSGTVYTDASIRALFSGGTGITYNSSTGAISYSGTVYTDSSVRALISMTTTGTSGASTYNNTTGVINVPNYTLAGLGGITLASLSGGTGITYNNTTGAISYSGTVYTDASVRALISATGSVSYNNTTGVISLTGGNLTEATSSVLTITGGTGAVIGAGTSIQVKQASSSVSGFLSSTDWNTFNGKASALSGTTNYIAKFTSSSAIGNSNIQDSGTALTFGVASTFSNVVTAKSFSVVGTNGYAGQIIQQGDIFGSAATNLLIQSSTSNGIGFLVNGGTTFNMFINSSGNIGIGTTSQSYKLHVVGGSEVGARFIVSGTYAPIQFSGDNSTTIGGLNAYDNKVVFGRGTSTGVNTDLVISSTTGFVGIATTTVKAQFQVSQTETGTPTIPALGTINNYVGIYLTNIGSLYGLIGGALNSGSYYMQVQRTDASATAYNIILQPNGGNILMGTQTDNGERLYISGNVRATGTITANSDISLKKNLLKIENALEKVEQINGYTYELKADDSKRHAGVIAQEIQGVLPEIVNTGNDGLMGVEYGNISALLIEAIKEQNTKIKNLETLLASK
jgi:hypothetical protein